MIFTTYTEPELKKARQHLKGRLRIKSMHQVYDTLLLLRRQNLIAVEQVMKAKGIEILM